MRRFAIHKAVCSIVALSMVVASAAAQVGEHAASRTFAPVSVATLSVPFKAWKHLFKARAAAKAQHPAECLAEIDKALQIAPRFPDAYLLRADREVVTGQLQAAIQDVLTAQQIEPTIQWSRIVLASAYNGQERFNDALVLLNSLQGREADSWQAKYEMARAETGRGNVEAALHWSALALAAAPPECADAHILRANALQLAHRWDEATLEMEAYLATSVLQSHRTEVLAAIQHTRLMARQ